MIIKCKQCGGDIAFNPGDTYGTCEYCGSVSTIPKTDDEARVNLFNRANHFRRQNEFDKALAAYERLLEQDDTDAEAHWGAVLSRFGIEYVEDPATHKRIPTCHRVQLTSILADDDYKAALQHAPDGESRRLYEEEATRIAEIQRGILAISQNEKPYDVFICYKETDDSGQRTHDSQWAQDVYYGLTEQGYKVFFSRITLEDKLGQEYEPYIFAALNSARVMVVIGSKPEHFNAVWVKNEWSRFLALMKNDRRRLLIPCYRDMDPYDLPDELSSLQSQDMSRIGFMQDLLRGVKKVLDAEKKPAQPVVQRTVVQAAPEAGAPGVASLMKRIALFMEDGDFRSAQEYIDRVLDIDPEYAPAYAARTCVDLGLRREGDLAKTTYLYDDNPDWQKALRFADDGQKAVYEGYRAEVSKRIDSQIYDYAMDCATAMAVEGGDRADFDRGLQAYKEACHHSLDANKRPNGARMSRAAENERVLQTMIKSNDPGGATEERLKTAADMFDTIGGDEAKSRAKACRDLAETARKKAVYDYASGLRAITPSELEDVARKFMSVRDYKDAEIKARQCRTDAEKGRAERYAQAVAAMDEAGPDSWKWRKAIDSLKDTELNGYKDVDWLREKAKKRCAECEAAEKEAMRQKEETLRRQKAYAAAKKRRKIIITVALVTIAVAVFLLVTQFIIPQSKYSKAQALRRNGLYESAIIAFTEVYNYRDAAEQIVACENDIKERDYQAALALKNEGKYDQAITAFRALGDYSNSKAQITACQDAIKEQDYQAALTLKKEGQYTQAITAFRNLGNYSDAQAQITACQDAMDTIKEHDYQAALALKNEGKYTQAITAFSKLGSYSDAAEQITETQYLQGKAYILSGDYQGAYELLKSIRGYKDVDKLFQSDDNLKAAASAALDAMFSVGNYVTYGTYPQTSAGNDSTPIEWLVLARDGNKALLLSRYGLDAQPYNKKWVDITWEKCTLRTWLNDTFINKAFTSTEQQAIITTAVDNTSSQGYSGWSNSGGNNTQDKVFLLSYAEANKYLGVTYDDTNNTKSLVAPTAYAVKQGAWTSFSNKTADGDKAGMWWLRSSGSRQDYAAYVLGDGSLYDYYVDRDYASVRPAFWLNLDSGIF